MWHPVEILKAQFCMRCSLFNDGFTFVVIVGIIVIAIIIANIINIIINIIIIVGYEKRKKREMKAWESSSE